MLSPELTHAKLSEIEADEDAGVDVPDVGSPAQIDTWRMERSFVKPEAEWLTCDET